MLNNKLLRTRNIYFHSFQLKQENHIPEFHLNAKLYQHDSKAKLLHFKTDDKNQTFATIFRSEPTNNKGTPHILEHLICCGSEKYPVRDPFMAMIKRSLNTYLNAWTGPDYICFPFASLNQKDFLNLQDVILDLVFKPTLSYLDFRQEGSRLDFIDNKLIYKGIVYNEMKGAMQNPESVFWQEMQRYLLNNTIYQHNSGGDPKDIPQLTYEELLNYYKITFNPSKAIFFQYGNDEPNFEFLNNYVNIQGINNTFQNENINPIQPPNIIQLPSQDGDKQCFLAFQTLIKEENSIQLLALQVISHVLFDNQNGLLYPIIEEGLAESFSRNVGPEQYGNNIVFSISFQGVEEDRKTVDIIQNKINEVLRQLQIEFPQDKIDAALHQIEAQFKMPSAEMGLKLLQYLINPLVNNRDYVQYLQINNNLMILRQKIEKGYLQELIKSHFQNSYILYGQPHKQFLSNLIEQEKISLENQQQSISNEQIQQIQQLNNQLDNREESDFSILPTLQIEDLSNKIEIVKFNTMEIRGVKLHETIQNTNGIIFFKFKFNLGDISEGTRQYLDLFTQLFSKFGTTNFSHDQISQMFSEYTLGLDISYDSVEKQGTYVMFSISCLNKYVEKTLQLLIELICNIKFKDRAHLCTLLRNQKIYLQNQIFDDQLQYAIQLASSQISQQYYLTDLNFNTKFQLQYAHHYLKAEKQRQSMYVDDFEFQMDDIMYNLMNKNKLEIIIHQDGSCSNYLQPLEELLNKIKSKYQGFDMDPSTSLIDPFQEKFTNIACLIPSQVNCFARSFKIPYYTHQDTAAIQVLADTLSNNYLHREIREKGGAYGAGCSVRSLMGSMTLWSYRDPNILETEKILDNLKLELDEIKLNEAKLTVFQRLDHPIEPQNKGVDQLITGLNTQVIEQMRQNIINLKQNSVKEAYEKYIKGQLYSQGCIVSEQHKDIQQMKQWQFNSFKVE